MVQLQKTIISIYRSACISTSSINAMRHKTSILSAWSSSQLSSSLLTYSQSRKSKFSQNANKSTISISEETISRKISIYIYIKLVPHKQNKRSLEHINPNYFNMSKYQVVDWPLSIQHSEACYFCPAMRHSDSIWSSHSEDILVEERPLLKEISLCGLSILKITPRWLARSWSPSNCSMQSFPR